jgi:phage gpG-like protein
MITLTPEQFTASLRRHGAELSRLMNRELPVIIGREAVAHFKLNFQNEGWERNRWPEVKRRQMTWERGGRTVMNPSIRMTKTGWISKSQKAATRRKILTGETADLGRSIEYSAGTGKVSVSSDLIYAAVHNFGLKAGRGAGFQMPKRQFIGESEILNSKIKDIIEDRINKILTT